jgi:hypothetical protein
VAPVRLRMRHEHRFARDAFKALLAGDDKVASGSVKNLLQEVVARLTPEHFKAERLAAQTKPDDLE